MTVVTIREALELALQHHRAGRLPEAEAIYRQVLGQEPRNPDALHLLGMIAHQVGQNEQAAELITAAIAVDSSRADFHSNLGHVHLDLDRAQNAYELFRQALVLDPRHLDALLALSGVCNDLHRWEEGLQYSARFIALNPDYGAVHWNRAITLLMLGRFEEGWQEFEWRLKCEQMPHLPRPDLPAPQWPVGEPLAGKTLLLHCEGGFGDALQFIRYLPKVVERAGRVLLECPRELAGLFGRLAGVSGLFVRGQPLPPFDLHCPLQSLPLHFSTTLETIPAGIPYLKADEQLMATWKQRLEPLPPSRMRVGLVWAGSSNPRDKRSRTLATFAPLAGVEGVQFVSLQKGPEAQQTEDLPNGMKLARFDEELTDFDQAAGLIENLDLLITVDTAAAHLAGAMGKPVWVLLPYVPDFRWLLEHADSPWYPTMRLFRQKQTGDWESVIAQVREALASRVVVTP